MRSSSLYITHIEPYTKQDHPALAQHHSVYDDKNFIRGTNRDGDTFIIPSLLQTIYAFTPTLFLNCFRWDSSITPSPHLNIFHCYPHQPPLPLPHKNFCCTSDTPKKIMRPPALRSNTTHSPQQLSPATIRFIASVWIREKYENFILSSFPIRGKYVII